MLIFDGLLFGFGFTLGCVGAIFALNHLDEKYFRKVRRGNVSN